MPRKPPACTIEAIREICKNNPDGCYRIAPHLYIQIRHEKHSYSLLFRYMSPKTGKTRVKGLGAIDFEANTFEAELVEFKKTATQLSRLVRNGIDPLDTTVAVTTTMPAILFQPTNKLFIDSTYQRAPDAERVASIVNHFDPALFQLLEVSSRTDGRFAVFDGGHRLAVACQKLMPMVQCRVHTGLTIEDEATYFIMLQAGRKSVTPMQRFPGECARGYIPALHIKAALESSGMVLGSKYSRDRTNKPILSCLTTLYEIDKLGILDKTMQFYSTLLNGCAALTAAHGLKMAQQLLHGLAVFFVANPQTDMERLRLAFILYPSVRDLVYGYGRGGYHDQDSLAWLHDLANRPGKFSGRPEQRWAKAIQQIYEEAFDTDIARDTLASQMRLPRVPVGLSTPTAKYVLHKWLTRFLEPCTPGGSLGAYSHVRKLTSLCRQLWREHPELQHVDGLDQIINAAMHAGVSDYHRPLDLGYIWVACLKVLEADFAIPPWLKEKAVA